MIKQEIQEKLKELYFKLYLHTEPICGRYCKRPHSCCSPEYGEMAEQGMLDEGITPPQKTGNPRCQYMSANNVGCTLEPYMRPICTMHVCCINSLGFKPGDPKWTKEYFDLREEIETLELRKLGHHI